jgi:hypothetical protein
MKHSKLHELKQETIMVILGLLSPNIYVSNPETLLPTILKSPKITSQKRIY